MPLFDDDVLYDDVMNSRTRNNLFIFLAPTQWVIWWAGCMFFLFAYFVSLRDGPNPADNGPTVELSMWERMTPISWMLAIGGIWFFFSFFVRAYRQTQREVAQGQPFGDSPVQGVLDVVNDMRQPPVQYITQTNNTLVVVDQDGKVQRVFREVKQ